MIQLQWGLYPSHFTNASFFRCCKLQTKEVAFADDCTVVRKLADIKIFWNKPAIIGPKDGYFPKATKSYLILKKIA